MNCKHNDQFEFDIFSYWKVLCASAHFYLIHTHSQKSPQQWALRCTNNTHIHSHEILLHVAHGERTRQNSTVHSTQHNKRR